MELDFVNNGPSKYNSYKKIFEELYVKIFKHLKLEGKFYTDVTIVDNKLIHEVNRDYRNIDRPTDVISFAFQDDENEKRINGCQINLGQIIISYEKAEQQAKEYGHSLKREMSFLFTHGILHLLGYDHMKKEEEIVMFKLQDEILGGLK